jgi:predicted DNA-binding protein (MmcQ/YjbR family)
MNVESFRMYCIDKPGVTEGFPFDETTLVFKVMNRMFAITSLSEDFRIVVKCDPEEAIVLREEHSCITPAWHFNKQHWNSIAVDGSLTDSFIKEQIDNSYDLIVSKLTKKDKAELKLFK